MGFVSWPSVKKSLGGLRFCLTNEGAGGHLANWRDIYYTDSVIAPGMAAGKNTDPSLERVWS